MKSEFKPYISPEKVTPEFTITSVIVGCLLAIIFGAANAYLGLRVGMTITASIPAAVISMGVIRVIMKKDSILESNMVQTIGSAGESVAAGAIFTLPCLFLWASEGIVKVPGIAEITVIVLCGGVLGVLFMVPLRKALIVKEDGVLPYPEGTACAEVLLAGEEGASSASKVFAGMGISALIKFIVDGLKVVGNQVTIPIKSLKTEFATEVYPSLFGVGYICGAKISSYLFAGGLIGWFVLIPAIAIFGGNSVLYPANISISELFENGGASSIWSNYIRYIGAGMVATGGIVSLIKSIPLILRTFIDSVKSIKNSNASNSTLRTDQDLDMRFICISVLCIAILIWCLPQIPVSILGTLLIVIFGFFFSTVSSRMVGLIGSSNNPVSGMTIATLLICTFVLKISNDVGPHGMTSAIAIGSVICILSAIAGDTSQDLKTGYILGATPKKQQIGELLGAIISAITIGFVLVLLNKAWGFGSKELAAPQATLIKMIIEGVMEGNLPWEFIFIGVFCGIVIEILGIPVLPVAIGMYLPLELSTSVMVGGIIRFFSDKKAKKAEVTKTEKSSSNGILFCSGLIAGEGLIGIILAIFAVFGIDKLFDLSIFIDTGLIGIIILYVLMIILIWQFSVEKKSKL